MSNVTDMSSAFSGLSKLSDISALANWDTGNVTNMNYMFSGDTAIISADALNDWNIANVNSFQNMFENVPVHPTFTNRAGTWDSNGTFTPSV